MSTDGKGSLAENAVTHARLLLQIIDELPTSIFIKDESLRFVISNKAHCELAGKSRKELIGKTDADIHPAADWPGFLARDRSVIETGAVNENEDWVTGKDGTRLPYLTRKSKLEGCDGRTYLIGTNTNLSEVKKREEWYRTLAETVPVGIWQVSREGETLYANPWFSALLGLAEGEKPGASVLEALGSGQESFPGKAVRFETDFTVPDGTRKRFLVISSGFLERADEVDAGAMVSIVDMTETTELMRINEEISRLNRQLSVSMQKLKDAQDEILRRGRMSQLGQLTATVAHELRNPLGAVRTAAFLIDRKIKGKGYEIEPQLLRITNGITRCDNIISQLLDFARTKALQCEEIDLDEWIAKTVEEEAERLPAMVTIECVLGLDGRKVAFDPGRLNRVIVNLMSNASEAMVGKGDDPARIVTRDPRIEIVTANTVRGIEISVKDNGPGISQENLGRILEPLFTTKNFGTGLGLPAVEKILEQHGGGLSIASEPGKGAMFTAWFPVEREAHAA